MSILVIDDDTDVREALAGILESEDYVVHQAGSGREGFELLRKLGKIRCVLLDMHMPNSDGSDFLRLCAADAAAPAVPVILLSATAERADFPYQVHAFVRKPPIIERLLSLILKLDEE